MLLNTSDTLHLRVKRAKEEDQREKMKAWVTDQTQNAMYLDDPLSSPANAVARIGTPMKDTDLEATLKKLNPSLTFVYNQFNSTKKMIYLDDLRGRTSLFPYESGIMPERSIMSVKVEMVPVPELYDNPNFVMNRKDLGKQEWDEEKQQFTSITANPYLKRVVTPWNEIQRGWRTILIKLVLSGAITPQQAESSFGAHQSKEWQNSLGKAKHLLPW